MDATRHPGDGDGTDPDDPDASRTGNAFSGTGGTVFQFRDTGAGITVNQAAVPAYAPRRDDAPYTVPAAPSVFVNRTPELGCLDTAAAAAAAAGGTAITVCTGLRGIGKSAAIRTWAARTRDRFPGGQLYVDFAEIPGEHGSRDAKDAIARVLRSLGVTDEFMPGTVEEMATLFRKRTAHEATLVVVEGAGEPAPVRMLVPNAPGSAVVVTEDTTPLDELTVDAARFVAFDPLDAEAGRDLLAEICGPDRIGAAPEAADRVVALCGGHPLALMVSAARLSRNPRLAVADLAAELADEDRRLSALSLRGDATVTAAFNTAYRALPDEAARAYRRLGLWPGPQVGPEIAAEAAAAADPGAARASLEGAGLIEPCPRQPDAVRFRHDLVRLHARDRAEAEESAEERSRLLRRFLEAYLVRLAFADRAVTGDRLRIADHAAITAGRSDPFGSRTAALEWLQAERAGIVAAEHAAVRAGLPDLAWPIAEAATALYLNLRYVHDWAETGLLGADAARGAGRPRAEARLRSLVSRPLADLDRLGDAGEQVRRAAALVADCPDERLRASVAEFRGRYLDRTEPDRAAAAYRESLELNLRAHEPRGAALARLFLGAALSRSGGHADAFAHLDTALAWFRESGDTRMAGRTLLALGRAHLNAGAADRARQTLEDAVAALGGGNPHYEARAREALADLLEAQGEDAAARPHLERALHLHTEHGSPRARELAFRLNEAG
ncbi:ATP-binding protein [Streptomonospora sediminis]